jgi:putative FmdB family regulatory protein
MPVYVYKNLTTGETFEFSQSMTEPALTEHPETGDPVKRLIQPVGIAFKGSGFYVTDSRGGGKIKTASGGKSGAGTPSSTGTGTDKKAGASATTPSKPAPGSGGGSAD